MDNKFKYKIIAALRKLTFQWSPRNSVRDRAKVAPNLFSCEKCFNCIYEGTSEKNFKKFKEEYTSDTVSVNIGRIHIDHIKPVVDPREGFTDWNDFINSLFCDASNLQALCEVCHKIKTDQEKTTKPKRGSSVRKKTK